MKKQEKRSPLKRQPLRNPGESLNEKMEDLLDDRLLPAFCIAVVTILLAGWEWWRKYTQAPPQPYVMTAFAIAAVGYTWHQFVIVRRQCRSLRLGIQGEKAVGQLLEDLRTKGYRVIHDVPGDGFNLDHVLVGPGGVVVVETKARSKPEIGPVTVSYDGEKVLFNGLEPDRNPIVQARAACRWLKDLLLRETGKSWAVKGVVIPIGWYVDSSRPPSKCDVWVLNETGLPKFLDNAPVVLKAEDIALAAARIEDHVLRVNRS